MNIDWAALGLVAVATVVAAIAIIGIFSLGVLALTKGIAVADDDRLGGSVGNVGEPTGGAKLAGYACMAVAGLLVLYGLYLIIPQFH